MATEAFTVRAELNLVHQPDQLAVSLDRSLNYMVNQALKKYLAHHAWQIEKITQGIAAADHGQLVDHDEVLKEMDDLINRKPQGKT